MLNKEEVLNWNRKYDKDHPWWTEKEKELGDKFRRTKELAKDDLIQVVEWKFKDLKGRKDRVLGFIAKNDDSLVRRISSDVFSTTLKDDFEDYLSLIVFPIHAAIREIYKMHETEIELHPLQT